MAKLFVSPKEGITNVADAVCNQGKCACGKPIVFRTTNGRVHPVHVSQ